jgi:hypothetical protein
MIRRYFPLLFSLVVCAFLLSQVAINPTGEAGTQADVSSTGEDILETKVIAPGERTMMTVRTTGLVEVTIVDESTADAIEIQALAAGETPRSAKVFAHVKTLSYPLSSQTGATFHIRIRHQTPGETTVAYTPGTSEEAMAHLRKGENLMRNQGTLQVEGFYTMPVYQLVPETIVKLEIQKGKGMVVLLKTLDYLSVKAGEVTLNDLCGANPCATDSNRSVEFKINDYEDRYLVMLSEDKPLEFTYGVIATPDVLNYIVSCG